MKFGFIPVLLGLLLWGCGEPEPPSAKLVQEDLLTSANIDTLGATNLAQGDTLIDDHNFTIVENTWRFRESGEVLAWEFYAERLRPVKLIVLRALDKGKRFELLGESETVIPKQIGINHFVLREPIPVKPRDYFGLIQPEEQAIAFKKVRNWKALGTLKPFQRPFMPREPFASYGWRYSVRVFYRQTAAN